MATFVTVGTFINIIVAFISVTTSIPLNGPFISVRYVIFAVISTLICLFGDVLVNTACLTAGLSGLKTASKGPVVF